MSSPPLRHHRVLVTGAAGFIGSHLVRRLLHDGVASVTAVDGLLFGSLANLSPPDQRLSFHRLRLGDAPLSELRRLCRGVSAVIHLAAEKHNQSRDNAHSLLVSNILGTQDLLEAAAAEGVERFIFSSSLYAYGRMTGPPTREEELLAPRTLYGISKQSGEQLVTCAGSMTALSTAILRFYFVYGPRQFCGTGYKSVIVKNFERIAANLPPLICGDGAQQLDYIYIDDVIDAILCALNSTERGEIFNVSSGKGCSVNELTRLMLEVAESPLRPESIAPDWTAGSIRIGDSSRLQQAYTWQPGVLLREGLESTFHWIRDQRSLKTNSP